MARQTSIEIGRIVAALLVVTVHGRPLDGVDQALGFFLSDGLARIGVPFFFVVTGYYLAAAPGRTPNAWLTRIAVLHLVWTALYLPLWWSDVRDMTDILVILLCGYAHLWYLPAVLCAGAMLLAAERLDNRLVLASAIACYGIGTGLEYYFNLAGTAKEHIRLFRNFLLDAYPLMATGHLLARHIMPAWLRTGRQRMAVLATALALFLGEITFSWWWIGRRGVFDLYVTLVLVAPALFLWLKGLRLRPPRLPIAKASAAVYFSHVAFLSLGETAFGLGNASNTGFALLMSTALVPLLIRASRHLPLL